MELSLLVLRHQTPEHVKLQDRFSPKEFHVALFDTRVIANAKLGANKFVTLVADDPDPLFVDYDGVRRTNRSPPAQKIVRQLPKSRCKSTQVPREVAGRLYSQLFDGATARRVVHIPVDWSSQNSDEPSCSHASSSLGPLFCVPLVNVDKKLQTPTRLKFHPLDQVLKWCHNSSPALDPETRFFLLRLEAWIRHRQQVQSRFLRLLFSRSASGLRLISCAHNPAHIHEVTSCVKKYRSRISNLPESESFLRTEVRRANSIANRMNALAKADLFIMNGFYGSRLPYRVATGQEMVQYMARDRREPVVYRPVASSSHSDGSDCDSANDDFPLHKGASQDNTALIAAALKKGYDPNQFDRDRWAPLHYAAWYGNLGAVQSLINQGNCSVNVRNKNGSTALHFAAFWGFQYVVELLLSHPDIKLNEKDNSGKMPLDYCDRVPKSQHQQIAELLRNAQTNKLPKIQVDLLDGSNMMIPLIHGRDTTAGQLLRLAFKEIAVPSHNEALFALWMCSDSIQLQLKDNHKPLLKMAAWKPRVLTRFSDCPDPESEPPPRLELRRDAKLSLDTELSVRLCQEALSLLFSEAHRNYIQGLYPCKNEDYAVLAAILLQIIQRDYGQGSAKEYLKSGRALPRLLPEHKLKAKSEKSWISDILTEHRYIRDKGSANVPGLQAQFLSFCWNLRVYGSAFFSAIVYMTKPKGALPVHVGVNDFGLHMINMETKAMFKSYAHAELSWKHTADRPYIVMETTNKDFFTLQTKQAELINTLLTKLSGGGGRRRR